MMSRNSQKTVMRKMAELAKLDKAKIQFSPISKFGLMEISRQKLRSSIIGNSDDVCPTCNGSGYIKSLSSLAISLVRMLEEEAVQVEKSFTVYLPVRLATYLLNEKRELIQAIEERHSITIKLIPDPEIDATSHLIDRENLSEQAFKATLNTKTPQKENKNIKFDNFDNVSAKLTSLAIFQSLILIKTNLKNLGISHDNFQSETEIVNNNEVQNVIDKLKKKNFVYIGKIKAPVDEKKNNWVEREQLLFRSTDFGDDKDRPLQKSDKSWTYFASDVAYHNNKLNRNFDTMINILGADHAGYIKRITACVEALSGEKNKLICKVSQLVKFIKDGKPFKMSKRIGDYITIEDLIKEVGKTLRKEVSQGKNLTPDTSSFTRTLESIKKGRLVKELETPLFSSRDRIVGPIKVADRFHLFKIISTYKKGSQKTLSESYDEIYQRLYKQKAFEVSELILDSLKQTLNIYINPEYQ